LPMAPLIARSDGRDPRYRAIDSPDATIDFLLSARLAATRSCNTNWQLQSLQHFWIGSRVA
jgi:hypothetical protein